MRKLHAEQASEEGTKQIGGNTEKEPYECEWETDLTEQIERQIGIIPHIPAKDEIDSHTAPEFYDSDKNGTEHPSDDPWCMVADSIDEIDPCKAEAAAKKHAEMRITAPHDLNCKIEYTSDGKEKKSTRKTEKERDGKRTNFGRTEKGCLHREYTSLSVFDQEKYSRSEGGLFTEKNILEFSWIKCMRGAEKTSFFCSKRKIYSHNTLQHKFTIDFTWLKW